MRSSIIKAGPWGAPVAEWSVFTGMMHKGSLRVSGLVQVGSVTALPVGTAVPAAPVKEPRRAKASVQAGHEKALSTSPMSSKRYIDQLEVEDIYGIPHRTLEGWRLFGTGPPYRKFGKSVKYQVAAIEAWIARQPSGGDGIPSSALKIHRRRTKAQP